MARRFRRSKFSPDRGWIADGVKSNFAFTSGSINTVAVNLFQFSDINAEALSGAIAADKSDWFVKRVILDIYLSLGAVGGEINDTARLTEWGVGICNDVVGTDVANGNIRPISDEFFDACARVFQTWQMPVYLGGVVPYDGETLAVTNPSTASEWGVMAPFWGPSAKHLDIEVSNAGLRPDQSCELFISQVPGPGSYNWDASDSLNFNVMYKVLLQKRRV